METKADLQQIIASKNQKIEQLEEEIRLLRLALFAPKSEKKKDDGPSPQLPLFDMPENPPAENDETEEEEIIVPAHARKKKGRTAIPDHIERIDVIHDIPEKDKVCACGCQLTRIGEEVAEKLDIIPAKMRVIRNIRPKYACKNCEGITDEEATSVLIAPPPPQIIPKGLATAGLLAHVLVGKFCDSLPFYRQEKQFKRLDIHIPRQSMCNWAMMAAEKGQPLLDLLKCEIRGGPLIHIDETSVQVLDEPGRKATDKSYMWVFRGGTPGKPVVIYQYAPTRSGDVAKLFLGEYQGVVQTDGYKGYDFLDTRHGILHVGCWAHARRKFVEASKAGGSKKNNRRADKALTIIRKLYRFEDEALAMELDADGVYMFRQEKARPVLVEFKSWIKERQTKVVPGSLFGKAVNYCLNQWQRLENYTKSGYAKIDNNRVENDIRPFVVGRKNWLFSGTPAGAQASALLYSLIETARANGLEPYNLDSRALITRPGDQCPSLHRSLAVFSGFPRHAVCVSALRSIR